MAEEKRIILEISKYGDKGLYMIFDSGAKIQLTDKIIRETAARFWNDTSKISSTVKEHITFQRCKHCPIRDTGGLCNSLQVILPFFNIIDRYQSFDRVIAVYKGDSQHLYYVGDTTMSEALKYTSILSLTQYCVFGIKHRKYFRGVIPISTPRELALQIYMNAYCLHKGNKQALDASFKEFIKGITESTSRQLERLRLICRNDAFLNAFVNTHVAGELLTMDMEKMLQQEFDKFK
jgi:hypothetical protein